MSFDPNLPAPNSPRSSAEMRSQLIALKALIDVALAGGVTGAQVDAVNMTDPNNPAAVNVSLADGVLHFTLTLPRGFDGVPGQQGPPGNNGNDGAAGPAGPQGAPFAQAAIDAVSTLDPGQNASVSVMFDGANVRFTFAIPRGADGAPGAPGEVTSAQMNDAIAAAVGGTSANTNAVATLDTPFADADAESMRLRFNELVLAMRR